MIKIHLQYFGGRGGGGSGGARGGRAGGGAGAGAKSSAVPFDRGQQAVALAQKFRDRDTSKADKEAIAALGTTANGILSSMRQADSSEGYTSNAFQGPKGQSLVNRINRMTGQNYVLEEVTTKGFMGYNFTKTVLKRKRG